MQNEQNEMRAWGNWDRLQKLRSVGARVNVKGPKKSGEWWDKLVDITEI